MIYFIINFNIFYKVRINFTYLTFLGYTYDREYMLDFSSKSILKGILKDYINLNNFCFLYIIHFYFLSKTDIESTPYI